ncbi:MAG TPA: response regulator transcription factor [Chloroflexota bacterium]|nr:response regulator transcription factor [Chloroflexota bacterium]
MPTIRVMLVDDHEIVRQGLRSLLERQDHLQVVGEAGTVAEAVEAGIRLRPDVIVMDVRLPDGTGIEACREIRSECPDVRVLILTSYADDDAVYAAIVAGAAGYLLKQTRGRDLVNAVERVAEGVSLLDPDVTASVLTRMRDMAAGKHHDKLGELSEQERRILSLIAEGKTNREIAATVFLAEKTVKNYVSTILSKLGMERRAQAAAFLADQRARGHE